MNDKDLNCNYILLIRLKLYPFFLKKISYINWIGQYSSPNYHIIEGFLTHLVIHSKINYIG